MHVCFYVCVCVWVCVCMCVHTYVHTCYQGAKTYKSCIYLVMRATNSEYGLPCNGLA